ncbi:MAG TPA: glycosyltransferase family 2 protein [Bacillota bacterium]|nr:glycosyltransferase family 2 protein [Bacillota bacterium]
MNLEKMLKRAARREMTASMGEAKLLRPWKAREKKMVTVVIPTYNREQYLQEAIDSVVVQTAAAWSLIIVDDASTDATPAVVDPYLKDKRISYVRLDENGGVSKALNQGLELVKTPFFLQLDSDDWLEKDAIERLLEHAVGKPEDVALFYGHWQVWRLINGRWRSRLKRSLPINSLCECTFKPVPRPRFYRTAALKEVGGWSTADPFQGRYMEDRQMVIRLMEAGYSFCRLNRVLYNLRKHDDNQSRPENLPKYRELKEWLYPRLIERWGEDKYMIKKRGQFAYIVPARGKRASPGPPARLPNNPFFP